MPPTRRYPNPTADPEAVAGFVKHLEQVADGLEYLWDHAEEILGPDEVKTGRPYPTALWPAAADETRQWAERLRERYQLGS